MPIKRYSKQRELIYNAVLNTNTHPSAETVYSWLKPENPALSLGTVYRNLKQLADEGQITRLPLQIERFDANTAPHPHFICKICGKVYDLDCIGYDSSLDELAKASGHVAERHELIFSGICSCCFENHEKGQSQL